jgi:hypothetical protein
LWHRKFNHEIIHIHSGEEERMEEDLGFPYVHLFNSQLADVCVCDYQPILKVSLLNFSLISRTSKYLGGLPYHPLEEPIRPEENIGRSAFRYIAVLDDYM